MTPSREPSRRYLQDRVPLNSNGYTQETPGMIVILIDQSESMNETWTTDGRSKAVIAADAVNQICHQIAKQCRSGTEWLPKVHLTVLGYCTTPNGEEIIVEPLCDGWPGSFGPKVWAGYAGGGSPQPLIVPRGQGGTPMAEALEVARACVEACLQADERLRNGFPPTIINITDGQADDYREPRPGHPPGIETEQAAAALSALTTKMGSALLFNLLIDPDQRAERTFFDEASARTLNDYGQFLFRISAPVPRFILQKLGTAPPPAPMEDLRGLVLTYNPAEIIKLLRWGSFSLR